MSIKKVLNAVFSNKGDDDRSRRKTDLTERPVGVRTIPPIIADYIKNHILQNIKKIHVQHQIVSHLLRNKEIDIQVLTVRNKIVNPDDLRLNNDESEFSAIPLREEDLMNEVIGIDYTTIFPVYTGFKPVIDKEIFNVSEPIVNRFDKHDFVKIDKAAIRNEYAMSVMPDRFYDKPINIAEYHDTVTQETLTQSRVFLLKRLIRDDLHIPNLNQITEGLLKVRTNRDANINDLVAVIEKSPYLSAVIMKTTTVPENISVSKELNIRDVVSRVLGFDIALNLLLSSAMTASIGQPKNMPDTRLDYLAGSILTAQVARFIARKGKVINADSMYLAGLLHDFGYLVISSWYPEQHDKLIRTIDANKHINPSMIDSSIVGLSRTDIAATVFTKWQLPKYVATTVQTQNYINYEGPFYQYSKCLRLAKWCISRSGIVSYYVDIDDDPMSHLNISQSDLDDVNDYILESLDQVKTLSSAVS